MKLTVNTDYSEVTGLRYCNISEHSGEDFYHKCLNEKFAEAYSKNEELILDIDGTEDGCGPSFIDESIGNLVYDFGLKIVKSLLNVISNSEPMWIEMIENETYPQWERRRLEGKEAKVTEKHSPWFRLVDNTLQRNVWITSDVE